MEVASTGVPGLTPVSETPLPPAPTARWVVACVLGSIVASIGFYSVLLFDGSLHGYDWGSHHFNYFDWVRVSLQDFRTLPLFMNDAWITKNFLANAESPSFSPLSWLLLWMPTDLYLKFLIVLYSTAGIVGMLALLRDIGVDVLVAAPAALMFAFGGFFVSHLSVGHPWAMGGLVLPGLLCLYRRAVLGSSRALWMAAALNAATILGGQHQPFIWQNILISLFALGWAVSARSGLALLRWALVVLASVGLAAVKLFPMLAEFADYDPTMRVQGIPVASLVSTLLAPGQHPEFSAAGVAFDYGSGWWEYAFYTGPFALSFILVGVVAARRSWGLLLIGCFFLLLSLELPQSLRAFEPWQWLERLPVWRTQRGPSRFLFLTLFCFTTVAAIGVQRIKLGWVRGRQWLTPLLIALTLCIGGDLMWQSLRWQHAATGSALHGGDHRPKPLRLTGTFGSSAELVDFAPNRLVYRATATRDSRVRFPFRLGNQTREWRVDDLPALTDRGKLAIDLPVGERYIVMVYRPEHFYAGAGTSVATIVLMGVCLAWRTRT